LVAREYVKSRENVILIEVDVSYNHQILLRELKKKCGEYGTGSLSIMLKNIVEALADRDYLLIVDEAENLTKKSLEFLRFIYDRSGTSILLCGTPKLISNIRGINLENQQLSSRIGMQVKLPSLNEDDIKLIAEKLIPGKTKCFNTLLIESKGNARRLSKIILRAEYISILNNTNITHDVIKKAADLLL
jgi:DNA transposition AAA+ family ATPase